MPILSPQKPEDNPVLIELLRQRLSRLNHLAFALVVRRLFRSMGLPNVELLGRRFERGRTADGGADLKGEVESSLGRQPVLIQIKRYTHPVPRHFIDELRSVMLRRHIPQGISVTTGTFSRTAREAAAAYPGRPIRLVDGTELATLMVLHRIGIREQTNLLSGFTYWTVDEEAFQNLKRFCLDQWIERNKRKRR